MASDRTRFVSRTRTDVWEEALIAGNGRHGVLCYGGPEALRFTLSHEDLFAPVDEPLPPPHTATILPRLRQLCLDGAYAGAAEEVVRLAEADEPRYARLRQSDPFVGAATLVFVPHGRSATTDYERCGDFADGVVGQSWREADGTRVTQELFVSRVDDTVCLRIAPDTGTLTGRLSLGPLLPGPETGAVAVPVEFVSTATSDGLALTAKFARAWPGSVTGYRVACRVSTDGEWLPGLSGSATVRGAREVTVVAWVDIGDGGGYRPLLGYARRREAHVVAHRALPSAGLSLGSSDVDTTTEELLRRPVGPVLVQRLFQAGQYAIGASTGRRPPTLQGVWSGTNRPAWSGDWTLDGNLQSALAASTATDPDQLLALFDLLDRLRDDFRVNAARIAGAPGLLVPSQASGHGLLNHFGPRWCLTFWTAGAAWLGRLYYEYWRHTGDDEFLRRRALPFLTEAAEFYHHVAGDGPFVFAPSYSPENSPVGDPGPQACVNATMDVAAVRALLACLRDATSELGIADPRGERWGELADRLPGYRVADDGSLAEWIWPGTPQNHAHRHASHLYPLWYEPDPVLLSDPGLREAARLAVAYRLRWWRDNGDEMAFGLVQLGLAAAALGEAELVWAAVTHLASRYWRPSLVSTHNAGALFNVDICGGFPALVLAMLVASHRASPAELSAELPAASAGADATLPGPTAGGWVERIALLPALPAALPDGELRRVRLRGPVDLVRLGWSPTEIELELIVPKRRELFIVPPPGDGHWIKVDGPVAVAGRALWSPVAAGTQIRATWRRGPT
jgi:hypothetical protein